MVLLLLFCLAKIAELSNEISNLNSQISGYQNQVNNMRNEINAIYDNVDEKLKKEASLLSSVDYSLGELNTETHMVSVTLKVVPKTLTDDMQLSVKVGSETVALDRNGNKFSAAFSVIVPMYEEEFYMNEHNANFYVNTYMVNAEDYIVFSKQLGETHPTATETSGGVVYDEYSKGEAYAVAKASADVEVDVMYYGTDVLYRDPFDRSRKDGCVVE